MKRSNLLRVAIHQPEFLPWPGYFHKMSQVDLFIILDNVQFRKNYFQNRNRIYSPTQGEAFLTVPILMKGYQDRTIQEMLINYSGGTGWVDKNWRQLTHSYGSHPYFDDFATPLHEILHSQESQLINLNMRLIHFFREALGVATPLVFASSLQSRGTKSELILDLARIAGATSYLSGPSGRDYLNIDAFKAEGIEVRFHNYTPPIYDGIGYRPYLSTLDVLMNTGAKARGVVIS